MKQINGICFPDIDVSSPTMIEKSKVVAEQGFQLDSLRAALQYVNDWSIAVDGGANIGTWTHELSNHFHNVYSIELAPDTFECLQHNIEHWGIDSNVHLMHRAISNVSSNYVGLSEGEAKTPRSGGRHIKGTGDIETIAIDDLKLPSLGFLKFDVEGHEAQALEGAQQTLKQFHPIVLIENKTRFANRYGNSSAVDILTNLGAQLVHKAGPNQIDWIFSW